MILTSIFTHFLHRIKHKIQRFVFGEILQTLLTKLLLGRALFGADKGPRQNQAILNQISHIKDQRAAPCLAMKHSETMRDTQHPQRGGG